MRPHKKKLKVKFENCKDEIKDPDVFFKKHKTVEFNDDNNTTNGSIIFNSVIPEKILLKIFCMTDTKSLLQCQLVCRHWRYLVRNFVWYDKAKLTLGKKNLPHSENIPWTAYYFICDERPFYKNLIKNASGEENFKHWTITENMGEGWNVESPPLGVNSLPDKPIFKDKKSCFVTSFGKCGMEQTINLIDEGFNEYILDYLQPMIRVSEWFCSRPNVPAMYDCTIKLYGEQKSDRTAIEVLNYTKIIEKEQMNKWFKFSHKFTNYGKGLRKIKFIHGGQDRSYIAGSCGSKMAGACVKLKLSHKSY